MKCWLIRFNWNNVLEQLSREEGRLFLFHPHLFGKPSFLEQDSTLVYDTLIEKDIRDHGDF